MVIWVFQTHRITARGSEKLCLVEAKTPRTGAMLDNKEETNKEVCGVCGLLFGSRGMVGECPNFLPTTHLC